MRSAHGAPLLPGGATSTAGRLRWPSRRRLLLSCVALLSLLWALGPLLLHSARSSSSGWRWKRVSPASWLQGKSRHPAPDEHAHRHSGANEWFYPRCDAQRAQPGFRQPPIYPMAEYEFPTLQARHPEASYEARPPSALIAAADARTSVLQQTAMLESEAEQRERDEAGNMRAGVAFRKKVLQGREKIVMAMQPARRRYAPGTAEIVAPPLPPPPPPQQDGEPLAFIAPVMDPKILTSAGPFSLPGKSLYWQLQRWASEGDSATAPRDPSQPDIPVRWFARSTWEWAGLTHPLSDDTTANDANDDARTTMTMYDHTARSADLGIVSFFAGALHVWGMSAEKYSRLMLPEWIPSYDSLPEGALLDDKGNSKRSTSIVFHPETPLALHGCAEWVEESSIFLSPAESGSFDDGFDDLLSPAFAHLRSLGLLDPSTSKRLYLFSNSNDQDLLGPVDPMIKYLVEDQLFSYNVHSTSSLAAFTSVTNSLCFRHVRWGRGPRSSPVASSTQDSHGSERVPPPASLLSAECQSMRTSMLWPLERQWGLVANRTGQSMRAFALGLNDPSRGAGNSDRISGPHASASDIASLALISTPAAIAALPRSLPLYHFDVAPSLWAGDRIALQQYVWKRLDLAAATDAAALAASAAATAPTAPAAAAGASPSVEAVSVSLPAPSSSSSSSPPAAPSFARLGWCPEGERLSWDTYPESELLGLGTGEDFSSEDVEGARAECVRKRRSPVIVWIGGAGAIDNEQEVMLTLRQELAPLSFAPQQRSHAAPAETEVQLAVSDPLQPAWNATIVRLVSPAAAASAATSGFASSLLPSPASSVQLLRTADIVLSVSGSGSLAQVAFMRVGGMLVQLQRSASGGQRAAALARGLSHLFLSIDLRAEEEQQVQRAVDEPAEPSASSSSSAAAPAPLTLSAAFVRTLAAEVASQWERHCPCALEEDEARRSWIDDDTLTPADRYPMADAKGDRSTQLAPAQAAGGA